MLVIKFEQVKFGEKFAYRGFELEKHVASGTQVHRLSSSMQGGVVLKISPETVVIVPR